MKNRKANVGYSPSLHRCGGGVLIFRELSNLSAFEADIVSGIVKMSRPVYRPYSMTAFLALLGDSLDLREKQNANKNIPPIVAESAPGTEKERKEL